MSCLESSSAAFFVLLQKSWLLLLPEGSRVVKAKRGVLNAVSQVSYQSPAKLKVKRAVSRDEEVLKLGISQSFEYQLVYQVKNNIHPM